MPVKNKGRKPRNPKTKPYFPHDSGYWAAKIGGRLKYLARWATPLADLDRIYQEKWKEAEEAAAKDEPVLANQITVKQVANLYVNAKCEEAEAGDISWLTWRNYRNELEWFTKRDGSRPVSSLDPTDFAAMNKDLKSEYLYKDHERRVATLRMAIQWAYDNGYLDVVPRYGTQFRAPGKRVYRKERAEKVDKLFSASELRKLIEAADDRMKAMLLLGINCAYLQSDLAALPIRFRAAKVQKQKMDLTADIPYIRFDRPKTGERRKCVLWPETVNALKTVIGDRTEGLVFLTRMGLPLVHIHHDKDDQGRVLKATHCDAVGKPFRELCVRAGCHVEGRGFSALRSTLETRAWQIEGLDAAKFAAIHWIMGHNLQGPEISKMADVYAQDIEVATLRHVTDPIRDWFLHSAK